MTREELKLCVEIGKNVRQIRENYDEIVSLQNDNDLMMREINRLLVSTGGTELTLEDILKS